MLICRLSAVALLSLCALAAVGISHPASAAPSHASRAAADDPGATVLKDFSCFVFLPPVPFLTTTDTHTTITPSGNTVLTCRFDNPSPPSDTLIFENFTCGTFLGVTTDSQFVATKGGPATLTCHINGSSA
jgi:hypothetical protein